MTAHKRFSPFQNWCVVNLASPPTLTAGAPDYLFQEADLSIARQSGADFSVGASDSPVSGAIISAAGGWFQAALAVGTPAGITLDGGSATPRFMKSGFSIGVDDGMGFPGQASGFDTFVPVLDTLSFGAYMLNLYPSIPANVPPGGRALWFLFIQAVALFGSDAIAGATDNFGQLMLWQVA